jgi:hypothetical protein
MQNNDYASTMAWPAEFGNTDISFLDCIVDEPIAPSLPELDQTVYGNSNPSLAGNGLNGFPATSVPS